MTCVQYTPTDEQDGYLSLSSHLVSLTLSSTLSSPRFMIVMNISTSTGSEAETDRGAFSKDLRPQREASDLKASLC